MAETNTQTALEFIGKLPDMLRSLKSDSLIEYTQPTRVEAIVLLDERAVYLPYTEDLLQTLNCIFSAYYLQAVSLAVNVGNINVVDLLDKINPNRALTDNVVKSLTNFALEHNVSYDDPINKLENPVAYTFGLPVPGEKVGLEHFGLSLEATPKHMRGIDSDPDLRSSERRTIQQREAERNAREKLEKDKLQSQKSAADESSKRESEKLKLERDRFNADMIDKANKTKEAEERTKMEKERLEMEREERRDKKKKTAGIGRDTIKLATDVSNLAVGKLLEVEIQSGNHKATFPILVRLITTSASPEGINHILSLGNKKVTMKERFHAWRAGQLNFISDLILCQDLISDHKKGLIKDSSGIYALSAKRKSKNVISALLTGNPSVATASNIIVITESTRKDLERKIGGRLKDFRTRENIFKHTYAMLLVVVDPEWEGVTIYHRSISTPTELSAKDLKFAKGKNPDIADMLKAYQLGQSPSF